MGAMGAPRVSTALWPPSEIVFQGLHWANGNGGGRGELGAEGPACSLGAWTLFLAMFKLAGVHPRRFTPGSPAVTTDTTALLVIPTHRPDAAPRTVRGFALRRMRLPSVIQGGEGGPGVISKSRTKPLLLLNWVQRCRR
jgi:hypothetical protein